MVALERQHVVPVLIGDLLHDAALGAHRIDGDNAPADLQGPQQHRTVISLDLSETCSWASTSRLAEAQALTMHRAALSSSAS